MKKRTYLIRSVSPLVMHNEQLADPLNEWARAIAEVSKKRKKTEDDHMELSRREFMGGLYWSKELGVHVPERCLEALVRDGAKKEKRGRDVNSAMIVTDPAPLIYEGAKDPKKMWEDGGFVLRATVGVSDKRIVRSRPIFRDWALKFSVEYDETVLQESDIDRFLEVAGRQCGLMDWRPKHGRFTVEKKS